MKSIFFLALFTAVVAASQDSRKVIHTVVVKDGVDSSEPIVFREGDNTDEVIKSFFGVASLRLPEDPGREDLVLRLKELVSSTVVTGFKHDMLISALAIAANEGHFDGVRADTLHDGRISYLEIGCFDGKNFRRQLNYVNPHKSFCVDPDDESGGTTHFTTSENFFLSLHRESPGTKFHLVFVDGLHTADQSLRDVWNALEHLEEGGAIVIHDASPATERAAMRNCNNCTDSIWNGDVFRGVMALRADRNLDVAVGDFDHGCAVVRKRKNSDPRWVGVFSRDHYVRDYELSFDTFDRSREQYLRLMSPGDLLRFAGVHFEAIPSILSRVGYES